MSICVSVSVCVSVRNRLPNHVYYGSEAFTLTGDSMGPEKGLWLNFIFKKLIFWYFWSQITPNARNKGWHNKQVPC